MSRKNKESKHSKKNKKNIELPADEKLSETPEAATENSEPESAESVAEAPEATESIAAESAPDVSDDASKSDAAIATEEMTEIIAERDVKKYTDDELEEMDAKRMAHVIMNDEGRTDMELLGEVFQDDAYSLKVKKKEAKKLEKEEKRRKSGETGAIRFLGTLSVLMAVAGIALVLLTVYFLAIAPTYNKSDYLSQKFTFPDSSMLSDDDYTQIKEGYYVPELATDDDADLELGGEGLE